jgi:hypothetical protein
VELKKEAGLHFVFGAGIGALQALVQKSVV